MKMHKFVFINNITSDSVEMYAKQSDIKSDTMYNVFHSKGNGLGVFDLGYVEVKE